MQTPFKWAMIRPRAHTDAAPHVETKTVQDRVEVTHAEKPLHSPWADAKLTTFWKYTPDSGLPIDTRIVPDVSGPRTNKRLTPGEVFSVSEERRGVNGVLYLKLQSGEGWLFDRKPDGRTMCVRSHGVLASTEHASSMLEQSRDQRSDDDQ